MKIESSDVMGKLLHLMWKSHWNEQSELDTALRLIKQLLRDNFKDQKVTLVCAGAGSYLLRQK